MEWENLDDILPNEVNKFDQNQISSLQRQLAASSHHYRPSGAGAKPQNCQKLKSIIDKLGWGSACAQGLRHCITSFEKFSYGDRLVIYILRSKPEPRRQQNESGDDDNDEHLNEPPPKGTVYGFIKVGYKPLFVMDYNGNQLEVNPLCVLDFYVVEEYQRNGYGKKLYEAVLRDQNVNPSQMAIDRPSPKFKSFLRKHYGLAKTIPQINNFVIYDEFFKYNSVRRNRNRLVDDFSDRRARSHYSDRSKSQPRPSYLTRQKTQIESSSTLPRIVNRCTPPGSLMQTMTKSELKHDNPDCKTVSVEQFQPLKSTDTLKSSSKRGEAMDKHYRQYLNQWAPKQRSKTRINTAFNIFGVRSNYC